MRMLKAVFFLSAVLGLTVPAFAKAAHTDLGTSRPGATAVKKERKKKVEEMKKTESADGMKKEEHVEKTEEVKP